MMVLTHTLTHTLSQRERGNDDPHPYPHPYPHPEGEGICFLTQRERGSVSLPRGRGEMFLGG